MAEYLIQGETLDAISHAINAKTGGSSAMTPSEMVTAIGNISGGGGIIPTGTKQISITQNGTTTEDVTQYANAEITVNVPSGTSLPSVISKIDGGSFTFASNTLCETYDIATTLNAPAKYFLIWTDDLDSFGAISNKGLILAFVNIRQFESASGTTIYGYYSYIQRQTNGSSYLSLSTMTYANQPEKFTGNNKINYNVGDTYYIAGKLYKWVAFA